MAAHPSLEDVRRRPGMWVGSTDDGRGILALILEVVGNSVDQHLAGRCNAIDVAIEGDGTIEVRDDGPGVMVDGGDGLPPLETRILCARGEIIEPRVTAPTGAASGTTVRFRPDATIFQPCRVPRVLLSQRLEELSFLVPALTVRWRIEGDELARGGLAAQVALLPDAKLGDPTRERLDNPEARVPVAAATERALEAWAARCPDLAEAVRSAAGEER